MLAHTLGMQGDLSAVVYPPLPLNAPLEATRGPAQSTWKLLAFALLIGVAAQCFGPAWTKKVFESTPLNNLSGIAALMGALFAGVVLHELGHLLAALVLDFEVLGGAIGPLRISCLHGKWAFQFSPRTMFSASVSAIPRDMNNWRARVLAVIAAGPVATLLTGFAAGACLILGAPATPLVIAFLGSFAQLSFFLFVLSLIPNSKMARIRNDARLFLCLLSDTAGAREILLYHFIAQLRAAGVRPRDYPRALISSLALERGRPDARVLYAQTIATWALDCEDINSAEAWQTHALELSRNCDPALRNATLAAAGFFDVLFQDDQQAARDKFAEVNFKPLAPEYFLHRAKAAFWLAAGNIHETLAEINKAQRSFPKGFSYYDFETTLLLRLHQKAISYRAPDLGVSITAH